MNNEKFFTIVSSTSYELDSLDAAEEVITECKDQLEGKPATAGLIYISIYLESDIILSKVMESFPDIELVGCSHDGVFSEEDGYDMDALQLTIFSSSIVDIHAGYINELDNLKNKSERIRKSVSEVTQKSGNEPALCILNLPSLIASGASILEEFKNVLPDKLPIVGGSAGDDWKFEKTFQFYKSEIFETAATYLLFSGDLKYGIGVTSGWIGKGDKGVITKSEDNIVYRIDESTAVEYFQKYLGEEITPLGEYPLVVYEGEDKLPYLRAALAANIENGSLIFAGDVLEGVKIQIGFTDRDQIIEASRTSLEQSLKNYNGEKPLGIICFSCSGRKQVLGMRTGEEFMLVAERLPGIPKSGFYGYGEIAPTEIGENSRFHNETFVTLLIGK